MSCSENTESLGLGEEFCPFQQVQYSLPLSPLIMICKIKLLVKLCL